MLLIGAPSEAEMKALAPALFPADANIPEMLPIFKSTRIGNAVFIVTGVGPVNAALAIGLGLGSHEDIDGVLYAGLAAAFDLEKTPLCSTHLVSCEIWPEYGLNDGTSVTARAFSTPLWLKEGGEMIHDRMPLQKLSSLHLPGGVKDDLWPECSSITVAGVTASFARRDFLWDAFHAELENMEGFAVAYAAARKNKPCVEIRVVDRKTGPRGRGEKDAGGAMRELGNILPSLNLIQRTKICH